MPLVTASQFNLDPRLQQSIQQGQQTRAFGQNEANKMALLQQQQEQLATRQRAVGVSPVAAPDESQEMAVMRMMADNPTEARKVVDTIGIKTQQQKEEFAAFATDMLGSDPERQEQMISDRALRLGSEGRDATQTLQLKGMPPEQRRAALIGGKSAALTELQRTAGGAGASEREFENLMEGFSEEEKAKARRVRAGLTGRAVGSAAQTIAETGAAEEVGESQAIIKQREKFAEMTGASRGKAIDKGFENIVRIDKGINTIDRAIATLEGGAKTGAVEKFLPSIRAASVELSQIEGQMALDVIGGVTLGAISEAELALAKTVALPKGLDEPQLIEHLKKRKAAQKKLRDYFQEQVSFIEQGGTVGQFLEMKKAQQAPAPQAAAQPAATTLPQGVTEDDIAETMRIHGVTREQVLQRLGAQ